MSILFMAGLHPVQLTSATTANKVAAEFLLNPIQPPRTRRYLMSTRRRGRELGFPEKSCVCP
jgi:hypothetical protein